MSQFNEPWHVDTDLPAAIRDENDNAIVWEDCPGSFKTDDLDRIVACVNACRGIPTEELIKLEPPFLEKAIRFWNSEHDFSH